MKYLNYPSNCGDLCYLIYFYFYSYYFLESDNYKKPFKDDDMSYMFP